MKSNDFGSYFKILTFGESHGKAIGAVLDGVCPGLEIDEQTIQAELDRRKPGTGDYVSSRKEPDKVEILSGVYQGKTTGAPVALLIRNVDARSEDYDHLKATFRPGRGDFAWFSKYGIHDPRGGGRLSGRETATRVAAGAVARKLLSERGIKITGFTRSIGEVKAKNVVFEEIEKNPLRCPDPEILPQMKALLDELKEQGDSIGGTVEVRVTGVPVGWGDPVFGKLDAKLSAAMMSIGGVKGVEFGKGFEITTMKGSQANDQFVSNFHLQSNNAGGISGGLSSGEEIVIRLAVKPTPSIGIKQTGVDVKGVTVAIPGWGRHDPVLCPRVVPVAEAMCALSLADAMLAQDALKSKDATLDELRYAIDCVDDKILHEVSRRIELAKKIGEIKRENDVPVTDAEREKALFKSWKECAAESGLDPDFAGDILELLLNESKRCQ